MVSIGWFYIDGVDRIITFALQNYKMTVNASKHSWIVEMIHRFAAMAILIMHFT